MPVKARARVSFSSWRNVLLPSNMCNGVVLQNGCAQACQCFILIRLKGATFDAFKLNADRVVVAIASSPVAGCASVPGPVSAVDKLMEFPMTLDIKVRRHLHTFNAFEIRVLVPVELVAKELLNFVAPILARGQADGVQYD